jgi:outer membrane protein insertion porin family
MHAGTPLSDRRPPRRLLAVLLGLSLAGVVAAWPAAAQGPAPEPAALTPVKEEVVSEEPTPVPRANPSRDAPLVEAIEIRSDEEVDKGRMETLIEVEVGAPLDAALLRRTLSNMHADGAYSEAEALLREGDGGGTVLVFVLRSRPRIARIDYSGELGLRTRLLKPRQEMQVDAPFVAEKLEASRKALAELYRRSGYLEAKIEPMVSPVGEHRVAIDYVIDSGPRARVGKVAFSGEHAPFTVEQLMAPLRLKEGAKFDPDRLEGERRRLQRFLNREQFLSSTVEAPLENYVPERGQIDLTFPIELGPKAEIVVKGEELAKLRKRNLLAFYGESPLDEISLEQSRQRIVAYLQERSYYHARVETKLERLDDGRVRAEIEIIPGERFRLQEVVFEGVEEAREEELRDLMSIGPKKLLQPGSGIITDVELEADLSNLTSYYRLEGFAEAEVGPPRFEIIGQPAAESGAAEKEETTGEAEKETAAAKGGVGRESKEADRVDLILHLPIDEGPRQRVVDIVLDGVSLFEREELLEKMPLRRGGSFNTLWLDDSINVLRALYEEEGYAFAQVEPTLEWNADNTLVDVLLTIDEGPQVLVDRLILRGQVETDELLISRTVALPPGSIVSRRRLVRAQRDLYRLGIFSRVDVRMAPATIAGGDRRDILVEVQETSRWRVSYGFSYHSEDGIGGLLSLSRINLGGDAGRLQIDLRGSENDRRARLVYDRPFLGDLRLPLSFALYLREEYRPSFDVRERGGQLSFTRDFENGRLSLLYDYRLVDLFIPDDAPPPDEPIEREDTDVEISSITPDLLYDRRDDPVDPTKGYSSNVRLEWAAPAFQADADFLKLFLQQTAYWNLGRIGVLAGSFRAGGIEPFSPAGERDPDLPDLPNGEIPISERFFAGGRTSHRAFARDALGILGETLVPDTDDTPREVGGNGLLLFNLDYRFPITGAFGGVIFLDAGNVWADWKDIGSGGLRLGAGVGARYKSPIGPVRVEVGWKLDPEPWESSSPVFFLSLGNPF